MAFWMAAVMGGGGHMETLCQPGTHSFDHSFGCGLAAIQRSTVDMGDSGRLGNGGTVLPVCTVVSRPFRGRGRAGYSVFGSVSGSVGEPGCGDGSLVFVFRSRFVPAFGQKKAVPDGDSVSAVFDREFSVSAGDLRDFDWRKGWNQIACGEGVLK